MCHTAVANIAVHNWKRTPSVTNRSPPERRGMRFHVVCLLFSTSGEVDPGYSPTTRIQVIWISPTTKGTFMKHVDSEERHMSPYKRPEPPPKPDDSD